MELLWVDEGLLSKQLWGDVNLKERKMTWAKAGWWNNLKIWFWLDLQEYFQCQVCLPAIFSHLVSRNALFYADEELDEQGIT